MEVGQKSPADPLIAKERCMSTMLPRAEALRPASQNGHPRRRLDPTEIDGSPHVIERQVCRVLTSQPGLSFSGLVVRRLGNGVCLSGVVETSDDGTDVCGLARQVAGVDEVVNRLLVRAASAD
jgi:hypothetical protein